MRLVHLSVRNHAAIPDLDIDVRDHLVLVGPNESGKTSLLRLLDAVFKGSKARLFTLLDADAIRDLSRPVVCTVVLASPDKAQKGAFADELELTPGKPTLLTVQVASGWDPAAEEVDVSRIVLKGGQEFAAISAQRLADVGFAFLPTSRSPDRELSRGKTSAMRSLLDGVDLQADKEKVEARLEGLHLSIDDAKSLGELRARLATQLGEVLPGEITADDLRLRLAADSAEDILAELEVWLTSNGQPRPLTGQSDGSGRWPR